MRSSRRTDGENQEAADREYLSQVRGTEVMPARPPGGVPADNTAPSSPWGTAAAPVQSGPGYFSGHYQGASPSGNPEPSLGSRPGAPFDQPFGSANIGGPGGHFSPPPRSQPGPTEPQYSAYPAGVAVAPGPVDRRELVTCPECGQIAQIDPAHREAGDFCRKCDYPLFWARSLVVLPSGEDTGASLRRLPGTAGRAATASVPCPHCGEPNSPIADNCLRCGLPMRPVAAPPPEPEPVFVPMVEAEPGPEPPEDYPWWWVLLVVLSVVVIGALVAWAYIW